MRLVNFTPSGNQVLAKVKFYNSTESGIILQNPEKDMFAEVLAVGPTTEGVKVGDHIMLGDVAVMHIPFDDKGKEITCILASAFHILGFYSPDKDETRIFVPVAPSKEGSADMQLSEEDSYLN